MLLQKTNRPQFSIVYTLIDHRNDAITCSKLRLRFVVPLKFYDVISMIYNSVAQGKLWSICQTELHR